MLPIMYELPELRGVRRVRITADAVRGVAPAVYERDEPDAAVEAA